MSTSLSTHTGVLRESQDLAWDVRAPGMARAFVRRTLAAWGCVHGDDEDTATLVVSELVTNVIQHADDSDHGPKLHLRLETGSRLRVSVIDGSAIDPVVRELDDAATSGRGMHLVTTLADRWGVERRGHGKAVWVELDLTATRALS